MSTSEIRLLPYQARVVASNTRFTGFTAGLGTGKTHSGCAFVVRMVIEQPENVPGFIGAQSYKQLHRVILPPLFEMLRSHGIQFEWREQRQELIANGRKIFCGTMDKEGIEAILGTELGWFWVDEAARSPLYSIELLEGRLRNPRASILRGLYTTTPLGFNWYYDQFVGVNKTEYHEHIYATSYDNPYLPADYIPRLRAKYSKKKFEQEVLAKFVSLAGGMVYESFEERHIQKFNHTTLDSQIYLGLDFNIAQMCGSFVKYVDDTFYVFDELYLKESNTIGASREIKQRFPNYKSDILVVPDSTFSHRSTNSSQTSKEILRREGFQIMPTRNPYIAERQEALNAYFWNEGSDRLKVVVHPRCTHTIKELFTLTHEDKEGEVSHLAVALGYVVWKLKPLRRTRTKPLMRNL